MSNIDNSQTINCSHTEMRDVTALVPNPRNPNKHDDKQIAMLAKVIRHQGWRAPIVVSKRSGFIVVGHGRLEAAKLLGLASVPVDFQEFENEADEWAHLIADNRIAELAEIDEGELGKLLAELDLEDIDMDLTGFDPDALAEMMTEPGEVVEDEVPEVPEVPTTKPGDLYQLGSHRLLCGDSTSKDDVAKLMGGATADLCFTSPPYGQQRDYTEESDCSDWDALMNGVFANLPMSPKGQVLVNLGLIHNDGEWIPYWESWIEWMRSNGWRRFGWYVWDQGAGMPGANNGRLQSSHEFIWHFCKENKQSTKWVKCEMAGEQSGAGAQRKKDGSVSKNKAGLIGSHRPADSVWRIQRQKGGIDGHPAPFSVGLAAFAANCWPGDIYEPFCGSGTTLIAAEQLGRKCYGMEISPQYCDVIVKRWETLTGKKAVLI